MFGDQRHYSLQLRHRLHWASQRLNPPKVAVVGAYHYGNAGDMALGGAVQKALAEIQVSSGLQTIFNLAKWPAAPYAIVGGGAIIDAQTLLQLAARYPEQLHRVAALGVEILGEPGRPGLLEHLRQLGMLGLRFPNSKAAYESASGQTISACCHDLAFMHFDPRLHHRCQASNIIGFNLAEVQCTLRNGRLEPQKTYLEASQDTHQQSGEEIFQRYRAFFRGVAQDWRNQGKQLVHVPFSTADNGVAQILLDGLDIQYLPYEFRPEALLAKVSQCERFYTTRFHALVFGLLTGAPTVPYCYAWKCRNLLAPMGLVDHIQFYPESLLERPTEELIEQANTCDGAVAPIDQLTHAQTAVRQQIQDAYQIISTT